MTASGDRLDAVAGTKQALREELWAALQEACVARFPGAKGRIPNFTGAEAAARRLGDTDVWRAASSIKGSAAHGIPTAAEELDPVDVVVLGCVAVDRSGAPLGKGGGFADLEFALASAAGLVGPRMAVVTTAHPPQVVAEGRIPMTAHDVPVDAIVTPDEVIECAGRWRRPTRVLWDHLPDDRIAEIPLLQRLAGRREA